jgi:hypothetical protein
MQTSGACFVVGRIVDFALTPSPRPLQLQR